MVVAYLAGKYSGNVAENIQVARMYAIRLWEKGYAVICPHLNTAHFDKDCLCHYEDYMTGYLEMVRRSDIVFMLPNWLASPGAMKEQEVAKICGIPIFYIGDHDIPPPKDLTIPYSLENDLPE